MKKYLLLFFSCLFAITLSSCEAGRHAINCYLIEREHKSCLEKATSDEEKEACETRYQQAMDEENDRHENVVNAEKEIDNCEKYQTSVLMAWGYSGDEAEKIAKKLRKCSIDYNESFQNGKLIKVPYLSTRYPKTTDYSFDCDDCLNELFLNGCTDKEGIQVFSEALPKFGLSSSDANQAIKTYYDDGLYVDESNPYHLKNPADECLAHMRIGRDINVTKELLMKLDLLDEDEDDSDESDGGDDETPTNPNPTNPNPTNPDPTNPNNPVSDNPGGDDANGNYQSEANAISKIVISKYGFNKTELSLQQQQELDDIAAFLKKWPKAEITIIGHTCNIGSQKNNQYVGELRAIEAKNYLIGKGISELRIQTESRDFSDPVVDNDNEEHRKQNRRVTFVVK